jgi:two-component system sensor histidine kinase MprB
MSLRLRLLAAVAATFGVVVIGCVYAAHVSASRELRAETDRFLTQRAREPRVQHGFDDFGGGRGGPGPRPEPPQFAEPDAFVQLIRPDGSVAQPSQIDIPVDDEDRAVANGSAEQLRTVTIDDTAYRVLTVPVRGGAVQIARSIEETNDVLSSLDLRLLLIALAGTAIAAGLAWVIARQIVRPIEKLTTATEEIARTQDLTHPIEVDRRDELGRLATSFNTMLVALRTSRDQQKRLVVDASHELRTPLTALRTNIEVLQRRASAMDDTQRAGMLAEVEVELTEFTALVEELVELATDTRADEPVEPVDLGELVERVVARMRRHTGREIVFAAREPAVATVRPGAIERSVANLVDNACKFSAPPTSIDVRVDGSRIEIADRGTGIDDADRAHVFDRFFRSRGARTLPGSGLGLSIVKQLVELHDGTVEHLPRDGGGTVARLTLPS